MGTDPTIGLRRKKMDLFAFIRHSDPTKVRVGERNLAEHEVKLLKMTEGHTVSLNPPVTAASGDSSDNIDKMFDEGSNADQEHLAEKDDDVLEEVVALDASKVVAEKAKKKRKRKVTGDASGSGSAIPSDATGPLVTASVTSISDVGPVDSMSGLNLRIRPPYVRYVVSSDSSHHSASYSEAASLVRSPAADVSVVMVAVTTTVDVNIAVGAKAKDAPKDFKHIGDSTFAGEVDADAASISKSKKPSISLDSFYASQSLDTETVHHVYVPRWKVTNDSVLNDPYVCRDMTDHLAPPVCLGAEVRMRVEHTLERKGELEVKCDEQSTLLSENDAEIVHLKSLLSLKEAEAAEAISLHRQLSEVEVADAAKSTELRDLEEKNFALEGERNVLSERVETLEYVATSKEIELASLSSQVATLTADLYSQKSSLESAFEFLKEQVEKMQDEQVGVLSERVAAIDSDLMEMVLHMDAEFYPRYLTTIAGRRWILSRGLKLVLAKCLSSPEYLSAMGEAIGRAINKGMQDGLTAGIEHGRAGRSITDVAAFNPFAESDYVAAVNALQGVSFLILDRLEANKDASMADVMDLLCLEGPAVETFEAKVAHNRVQRLRGDATARRLSLTDSILSLVEPLSTRNFIGEPSSSTDLTTAVMTALSTTFV
ncbi:hypothetical protein Tco_0243324 [Tanacetum coccineum]